MNGRDITATRHVYLREDPTQDAFRTLVSLLDDTELVHLEDDLDLYQRSGLMSEMLDQILANAESDLRQVA